MSNTATTILSGIKDVDDSRHMDLHETLRIATEEKNAFRHWADIRMTTPSTANTEFGVEITGFNRTPTGYVVIRKDKAADIYDGTTAWAENTLYLKCSVASATVTIRVIG